MESQVLDRTAVRPEFRRRRQHGPHQPPGHFSSIVPGATASSCCDGLGRDERVNIMDRLRRGSQLAGAVPIGRSVGRSSIEYGHHPRAGRTRASPSSHCSPSGSSSIGCCRVGLRRRSAAGGAEAQLTAARLDRTCPYPGTLAIFQTSRDS
jgi:hypothetical protein